LFPFVRGLLLLLLREQVSKLDYQIEQGRLMLMTEYFLVTAGEIAINSLTAISDLAKASMFMIVDRHRAMSHPSALLTGLFQPDSSHGAY